MGEGESQAWFIGSPSRAPPIVSTLKFWVKNIYELTRKTGQSVLGFFLFCFTESSHPRSQGGEIKKVTILDIGKALLFIHLRDIDHPRSANVCCLKTANGPNIRWREFSFAVWGLNLGLPLKFRSTHMWVVAMGP